MRETKLNSYVCIQCGNDTTSLGGGFSRLKSTVKAGGSFVGINGKVCDQSELSNSRISALLCSGEGLCYAQSTSSKTGMDECLQERTDLILS